MFSSKNDENEKEPIDKTDDKNVQDESFSSYSNYSKYKALPHTTSNKGIEMGMEDLEKMLETEKINNKIENWNKLDKTQKIQKLHQYAETYGKEELPVNDVKALKTFFKDSLNKNKLQNPKISI